MHCTLKPLLPELLMGKQVTQLLRHVHRQHKIKTLNVAGSRESKRPGIYRLTRVFLDEVDASNLS